MYIEDIKKDFYEYIIGKRLCIMIHYDIDSVCTCKILQSLLRHKNTLYTLVVVEGVGDLKSAYLEQCDTVKCFLFVNCGGSVDIVEVLEPEEDVVFFVLDSHRPTDVCNIYSSGQVRILGTMEEDNQVPDFGDLFREDESDEEEDNESGSEGEDSGGESGAAKRRRLGEEAIMERRERRLWEDNRNKLMFEYSQFTYYAKASAIIMFDLAWKLNKDDRDLVWYAIVALTEQMLFEKIENTDFVLETGNLQAHVTRLQNRTNNSSSGVGNALKLSFEKDLRLTLYRHWTVESSLKYSMFTACKLKLWSIRADKKMGEVLADMGLPIAQSQQTFFSMDLQLRQEFQETLEKLMDKYGLSDIVYASFTLQSGYRHKYCASDVVYSLLSILEASPKDKNAEERFHSALDCLSRSNHNLVIAGIEKAKVITKSIFRTVQSAVDMRRIITAGPFVYYIIQEGCLDWYMFSHLHVLSLLAHFILRAYAAVSRNKRASSLPLIISAPKDIEKGTCIMLAIPPLCENSPKNFFGKAFEQAAEKTNAEADFDYFDTSYIILPVKDRTRFLDALTVLLN